MDQREEQLKAIARGEYDQVAKQLKLGNAPSSAAAYEKAIAKLGYSLLSEQAPELLAYTVGFQLLDKSDDGDFAAGFFIFDLGGVIIDCPIFLIDGQLKGYQLLFMRDQGIFVPLLPEVVEYILNRQHEAFGEAMYGEAENRPNRASTNFDMYSNQNRYLSKSGSYPEHFTKWGRDSQALESFLSIMADARSQQVKQASLEAKRLHRPELYDLLESRQVADELWRRCQASPKFNQKVANWLGKDWAEKLADYYRQQKEFVQKTAAIGSFQSKSGLKLTVEAEVPKLAAFSSLDGFRSDDEASRRAMVNEILEYGAAFFDEREGNLKTAMLMQENFSSWSAPMVSGNYLTALLNGDTAQMLVILPGDCIDCGSSASSALVINKSDKSVAKIRPQELAVRMDEQKQDVALKAGGDMSIEGATDFSPGSLGEKDWFVLVDAGGKWTMPLRITSKGNTEGVYEVEKAYLSTQGRDTVFSEILGPSAAVPGLPSGSLHSIIVTDKVKTMRLESMDGRNQSLLVPSQGVKMIKLANQPVDGERSEYYTPDPLQVELLPLSQIGFGALEKKASFSTRRLTSNVVEINDKAMDTKSAIWYLMTSGLSKQASIEAVTSASGVRKKYAAVDEGVELWQLCGSRKLALTPLEMNGDSDYRFAAPSPPREGYSNTRIPVREVAPQRESIVSDGMEFADESAPPWSSEYADYAEPRDSGPGGGSGGGGEQLVDQDYGDELFENSLFISLVSNNNTSIDRNRLLSGLMRTCDETGRALFMLYAHGEDYAEAYGMSDLSDFEEQLLTVFEGAGQLFVALLERSVKPASDLQLSTFMDS